MAKSILSILSVLLLTGCTTSTYYKYDVNVQQANKKIDYIENDPTWIIKAQDPTYHIAYPHDFSVLMYSDEFEYESNNNKSTKIVIAPFMYIHKNYGLKCYHGATVYYKDKKIGKVESADQGCSDEKTSYMKYIIPRIAMCAARVGFNGTIGGETYKEGEKSPSLNAFFQSCDMNTTTKKDE